MPMIVNTAWLLEYLEPKCSHEELLDALPRLGLEVEQTHELTKQSSNPFGSVSSGGNSRCPRTAGITTARSSWKKA